MRNSMKTTFSKLKLLTIILAMVSVALLVASFFMPPTGVIDPSVIGAVGELFAFGALFAGWESIEKGMDTKFGHGDSYVEIKNPDKEDNDEN